MLAYRAGLGFVFASALAACSDSSMGLRAAPAAVYPPFSLNAKGEKIKGITLVAPPEPFAENPIPAIQDVGAGWIAVIPYAYTRPGQPRVQLPSSRFSWWGERKEGVQKTVRLAHAAGLRVMLKPQVYVPGSWTGALDFERSDDWQRWEADYAQYILSFARLAADEHISLLCIGTELGRAVAKRPAFFRTLISQVRAIYPGKLTYSANWDEWDRVPFWPDLDYVGISAYFPLLPDSTPTEEALRDAWGPIVNRLSEYHKNINKPILFTEYGYLSVDGSGWRNWELEPTITGRPINEAAQAHCLSALLGTWLPQDAWAGGFLWKWFPNMRGHEGYPERDYTPQGKQGEAVLRRWYRGQVPRSVDAPR